MSGFDCGGHESLNDWLKRFAFSNEKNESVRTYVVHRSGVVAGYYSISAGSLCVEEAPARISKGLARHPIPVILLARLAVDKDEKGTGLGKALLKDALLRIAQAATSWARVRSWCMPSTSQRKSSVCISVLSPRRSTNCN